MPGTNTDELVGCTKSGEMEGAGTAGGGGKVVESTPTPGRRSLEQALDVRIDTALLVGEINGSRGADVGRGGTTKGAARLVRQSSAPCPSWWHNWHACKPSGHECLVWMHIGRPFTWRAA